MPSLKNKAPIELYRLENYLFATVGPRFHESGFLDAFDFFCIVIWKANRAKSRVAGRLLANRKTDREPLDKVVRRLTAKIFSAKDHKTRLSILIDDWKLRLPLASAILTVLYPDDFTVYDERVCRELAKFQDLKNRVSFESIWTEYQQFIHDVREATPPILSLRDSDRYLWGQSFIKDLRSDIANKFAKTSRPGLAS